MAQFQCDDPEVQSCLKRLAELVTSHGGRLSDELTVYSVDGNMGVSAPPAASSQQALIDVPEACFLPAGDVSFSLSGMDLCIDEPAPGMSAHKHELLALMVEIYNCTDKIAKHRDSSPRYVFSEDAPLRARLTAPRSGSSVVDRFDEVAAADDWEPILIRNFLSTRRFDYAGKQHRIIPFIDFVNHHSLAPPVEKRSDDDGQWWFSLTARQPVAGSPECFANYGFFDACDTYLMFGFVGAPSGLVRSVPLQIELAGIGTIDVQASAEFVGKTVYPEQLRNLGTFLPNILAQKDETLTVSHLMIPHPRAPHALRRILVQLIEYLHPGLPEQKIMQAVGDAEQQLIRSNIGFYTDLSVYLDQRAADYPGQPVFDEARTMASVQLDALRAYRPMN